MKLIDISELSRQTGLAASALRHYEEKGLIASVGRRGLKRLFDADAVERVTLISLGRAGGFSLDELKDMFGAGARPALSRQMLARKADDLDDQIARLGALRDMIRHVAKCPHEDPLECSRFRKLMRIAARAARALPRRRASSAFPGSR